LYNGVTYQSPSGLLTRTSTYEVEPRSGRLNSSQNPFFQPSDLSVYVYSQRPFHVHQRIRYAAHIADNCRDLWKFAHELGLEGIVCEDVASTYSAGRTTSWQKIETQIGAERERHRFPA
jgi:hypothetical protein